MKNIKKKLAIFLALGLTLTACGSKGNDSDKTDTDNTTATDGKLKGEITLQAEETWKDYYQKAIDKITKENPEAKISLVIKPSFDHIDIIDKTDATNKDVADVFALPADRFTGLAENDVLAALDAKAMADELGGFSDYDKGLGGNLKLGEDYLAFPYNIETLITFVNTANAKTLGIDSTKKIEVLDQKDAATVLLPMFDAWYGVAPNNAGSIDLLAKEGDSFKSTYAMKYEELSQDQKAVFDAIYGYWKLHNDQSTSLFDENAGWGYIDDQFKTGGKGVFRLGGPWEAATYATQAGDGNLAIYPIGHITIAGKPLTHWQGGWALGVNARIEEDADKMALAQAVIKELVNPQNAVELYKSTGKILENVTNDVYEKSDLSQTDKDVIKNVLESYTSSPARPLYKEYGKVWDTWKNSVLSWNSKKPSDAKAAYTELNAAFTDMMQQIGQ